MARDGKQLRKTELTRQLLRYHHANAEVSILTQR
jgi:hypothetical protein